MDRVLFLLMAAGAPALMVYFCLMAYYDPAYIRSRKRFIFLITRVKKFDLSQSEAEDLSALAAGRIKWVSVGVMVIISLFFILGSRE